ncbi:LuxR C-terminal-related transcriptional regulator [Streptomyces viridiviolaceus]|uniref:LuxR C-terminal-related transcriptional regulator n=2 Tax=Streptomyces viridiviolaceus TaxID=68282 RepID=A0ABW2ECY3_9ACTN|nr:helix-turn-helix transcriptional regulator [Streptomyces viridiviolaceus]
MLDPDGVRPGEPVLLRRGDDQRLVGEQAGGDVLPADRRAQNPHVQAPLEQRGLLGGREHLGVPYDRARVNSAYGQTLRRAGERREADTVLKNARDAYATLGVGTYVERCDRELQAGGLQLSRAAPGMARLTPQEQAVARLVAAGATNQQAALELFISVKTVQYHLTHVYAKLGIRSRSELAATFREASPAG